MYDDYDYAVRCYYYYYGDVWYYVDMPFVAFVAF